MFPRLLVLFCLPCLLHTSFSQQSVTAKGVVPATCPVTRPAEHPFRMCQRNSFDAPSPI